MAGGVGGSKVTGRIVSTPCPFAASPPPRGTLFSNGAADQRFRCRSGPGGSAEVADTVPSSINRNRTRLERTTHYVPRSSLPTDEECEKLFGQPEAMGRGRVV